MSEKLVENNLRLSFKVELTGEAARLVVLRQTELTLSGTVTEKNRSIVTQQLLTEYSKLLKKKNETIA